jgi:hypothetical protein
VRLLRRWSSLREVLPDRRGTVRATFGHFNTREHAEALVAAVREIRMGGRVEGAR